MKNPDERVEHKGLVVEFFRENYPPNPYELGDGLYPMITSGGNRFLSHDYHNASEDLEPSRQQYGASPDAFWTAIGEQFGNKDEDYDEFLYTLREKVESRDLRALANVAQVLDLPYLLTTSRGYSQGDAIDLLVIWTPSWGEMCGVTKEMALKDDKKDMRATVSEYGAYAWGDVYKYDILGKNGALLYSSDSICGIEQAKEDAYHAIETAMLFEGMANQQQTEGAKPPKLLFGWSGWVTGNLKSESLFTLRQWSGDKEATLIIHDGISHEEMAKAITDIFNQANPGTDGRGNGRR